MGGRFFIQLTSALLLATGTAATAQDMFYLSGDLVVPEGRSLPFDSFEVNSANTAKTQIIKVIEGRKYRQALSYADFPTVRFKFPIVRGDLLFTASPVLFEARSIADARNEARVSFEFAPSQTYADYLLERIDEIPDSDDCDLFGVLAQQTELIADIPVAELYPQADPIAKYLRTIRAYVILLRETIRHCNFERILPTTQTIATRLHEASLAGVTWKQRTTLALDLSHLTRDVRFEEVETREVFSFVVSSIEQVIGGLDPRNVDKDMAGVLLAYVRFARASQADEREVLEKIKSILRSSLSGVRYVKEKGQIYYEHFQVLSGARNADEGNDTYEYSKPLPSDPDFSAEVTDADRQEWCEWYALISADRDIVRDWKARRVMSRPRTEINALAEKSVCKGVGT
jgi:hypothetical protein